MREFILGTDWWTDCDDALALRLLARAHLAGEIRLQGIGINACMEYSAASVDGFLHSEGVCDVPLGIDLKATDFGRNPPYQKNLAPLAVKYRKNEDAEDAVRLYRRLLAQSAQKVEIIEIGYLNVLADVLQSAPDDVSPLSGVELVRQKVEKIWLMAGKWDENPGSENNFNRNARARKAGHVVCRDCPVEMVFLGWEVGASVLTGGRLQAGDVLHRVLCDHGSEKGRSSWDPMLCLMAMLGDEEKAGYKAVRGTASVEESTGENRFAPDETGKHAYVVKLYEDQYYRDAIDGRL